MIPPPFLERVRVLTDALARVPGISDVGDTRAGYRGGLYKGELFRRYRVPPPVLARTILYQQERQSGPQWGARLLVAFVGVLNEANAGNRPGLVSRLEDLAALCTAWAESSR
jgi:hypothetical protein